MIPALLFSVALFLASPGPASAQDASIDPAAAAQNQVQNQVRDQARAEAGMQALTAALETLRPEADAIRADAGLPDTTRRERLLALLDRKDVELDAFEALVAEFARAQLVRDGSTPEQIELGTEIVRQHLMAGIIDNFTAGRPLFAD